MSTWENIKTSEGSLYYCQPSHKVNSDKIIGFDLDWTLIKPEIGKQFPVSADDWICAYKMDKLRDFSKKGYKIVVFTNQKGSFEGKGKMTFEDFKERWFKILDALKVPAYIMVAPLGDFYRKPSTYMWDFMVKHLNNNINPSINECLYVGDAAGRSKDHSDCDIKFAINIGIKFMTPEEFFENSNKFSFQNLKNNLDTYGFNPNTYLGNLKDIHKINHISWETVQEVFENPKNRLLVLVGSPASGKTCLADLLEKKALEISSTQWNIYSLDKEGCTKKKLQVKVSKILKETDEGCIIDCTNGTIESRNEWIKLAKEASNNIRVVCIFTNVNKDLTIHLNKLRSIKHEIDTDSHSKGVPIVAIHTYWKKFEKPTKEEGFDKVVEFDFEPKFKTENEKKQFLTWF